MIAKSKFCFLIVPNAEYARIDINKLLHMARCDICATLTEIPSELSHRFRLSKIGHIAVIPFTQHKTDIILF